MPGPDPGIHVLLSLDKKGVDGQVCAKMRFTLLPGHDEECPFFATRCKARRISNYTY